MNATKPLRRRPGRHSLAAALGVATVCFLALFLAPTSALAQATGHRSITFDLPADLLAAAVTDEATSATNGEGKRQVLWMLLAGNGGPPTLHRMDSGIWERGPQQLELTLDAEVDELAPAVGALDSDETLSRLLVGKPGAIFELVIDSPEGLTATVTELMAGAGAELTARPRPGLSGFVPRRESWPLVSVGRLELRDLSSGKAADEAATETFPLPVEARRSGSALLLTSPPVSALRRPGIEPLFAAGPEAFGKRRLRTFLLNPPGDGTAADSADATSGDSGAGASGTGDSGAGDSGTGASGIGEPARQPLAAWSLLPDPEEVAEAWYAQVDGRPMLLVSTFRADRVGIFETHRLRLFLLEPDRRRAGRPPVLAVDTASRRWQALGPAIADLDDDGHDDLLLLQPKGLDGDTLLVEAYSGDGQGGFSSRPRKTVLPVESDGVWQLSGDLDGDGRPDLVVLGREGLAAFAGISHRHRRRVLASEPLWRLPVTAGSASPAAGGDERPDKADENRSKGRQPRLFTLDLDGDGRREAVLLSPQLGGPPTSGSSAGGTHVLVVATRRGP